VNLLRRCNLSAHTIVQSEWVAQARSPLEE
jgi:hypothetical protein